MNRPLILNVDDNDLNRYLRSQYLSSANYELIEARTGSEALGIALEVRPDLVLLDVNMPDMDGIEVCRNIKQDPRTKGTMVLQISASAIAISDAVRALDGGADGYLIEPVESELLLAHIRSLLRLRDSEAALRRLNDRLQQFGYLASHDLQEPLRHVVIFSALLEQDYKSQLDETGRQHLERVTRSAVKLRGLLEDLLTYSRVSTLENTPVARVSLDDCLRKALSIYESAIEDGDARIVAQPLPLVLGDEIALAQVFQNLVGNSIKYRKPNHCVNISISACTRAREVVVSVQDDGLGFPPEFSEQIFGVFKRLHSDDIPGSGVGLAVCRAIVERHGGAIWAEGQEGRGATFNFSLPAYTMRSA